ncbi:hypothetical protein FSP39_010965 [Pinctada imbricata]|uniref:Kinase suppressor of Ras 2 n=1 Tax=Pinctada imbricata TaxID=66713 RepID=A0AA88XJX7_PINIB|nr:hypothetical protein FSP39_010965 [Pinctada imbricata]
MSETSDAENDAIEKACKSLRNVQDMIDLTAIHLRGLRTECSTTSEITQNEIKTQESKLIKLFSKQLVEKALLKSERVKADKRLSVYPKIEEWLSVVGLKQDLITGILQREVTLTALLAMSEQELRNLLLNFNPEEEDIARLIVALRNLKIWTDRQLNKGSTSDNDIELHWTNYNKTQSSSSSPYSGNSPKYHSGRPSTSSLPETTQPLQLPTPPQSTPSSPTPVHVSGERYRYTPPPTPPQVRPKGSSTSSRYPSTPPPSRNRVKTPHNQLYVNNMTRSKSAESQLPIKVTDVDGINKRRKKPDLMLPNEISHVIRRPSNEGADMMVTTLSGHASPVLPSPPYNGEQTLIVPKSPKSHHKVSRTFCFFRFKKVYTMSAICDVCKKHIILMGKFCRVCKFKCHRDCANKAPLMCYPDHFWNEPRTRDGSPSPGLSERNGMHLTPNPQSLPDFHNGGSDSNSSCNSSTPSSPITMHNHYSTPSPGAPKNTFVYPDLASSDLDENVFHAPSKDDRDVVSTNTSDDSNKTLVDSNTSEKTLLEREDSMDSQDGLLHRWDRGNSLSITLKEWDIPYEQLKIGDVIGTGRFGTVYKGIWHGSVAIKMLNMDEDTDNQAQISAFKLEVAMLKNTRHENLLLFMGACMKPPHLAIVTSYCSGQTLYTHVRSNREKLQMNKIILIAQQIAQGMGYLHARNIVHKDLKTKNIFLENGKVVITDFGLFNVTKLCHGNRKGDWLHISPGWLCYLSPEIIRQLNIRGSVDLKFTERSDIFAFGTIWYELLVGEWPFRNQPPESIIWQVGRGIKQSLGMVAAPREVKELLLLCWLYKMDDRPGFKQILKLLDRLPKKRLVRSPSHPVQLSRSVDSVFTA